MVSVKPARSQADFFNPSRVSNFATVAAAVMQRASVDLKLKGFLCVLASWCNAEGICFPGVEKIASKCGVSVRTVERFKAKLEASGDLEIRRQASPLKTDLLRIVCVGGMTLDQYVSKLRTPAAPAPKPPTPRAAKPDKPKPDLAPKGKDFPNSPSSPDFHGSRSHDSHEGKVGREIPNLEQAPAIDIRTAPPAAEGVGSGSPQTPTKSPYPAWYLKRPATPPSRAQLRMFNLDVQLGKYPEPPPHSWLADALWRAL